MSVQSFIKWAKTAKLQERITIARIIGRAWCMEELVDEEKSSLVLAMTHLLDDSSSRVRLSLARAIALSNNAPKHVVIALCEDHPDVSGTMIMHSPVLSDNDLIDLISRGNNMISIFIASRYKLSDVVAENLVENGCADHIIALLGNKSILLSSSLLMQIVERFYHNAIIRDILSSRADLPLKAQYLLMKGMCKVLCQSKIVHKIIPFRRIKILSEESMRVGILEMVSNVHKTQDLYELVDILQKDGQLTPALLIYAIMIGAIDFVVVILANISEYSTDKVRSILFTGGFHVIRSLYELVGIISDISDIFVETTIIWREVSAEIMLAEPRIIAEKILKLMRKRDFIGMPAKELMEMIERIYLELNRKFVRSIAKRSSSRLIVAA
ncbi:DUF2336 domain-containing protein [Candidatus Liberibacter brunswickensis]|uniref:DUF2336 domain-containing protein n=1 Tax=Candidatus Liberibacter brunswickensis TaxID=1968796 RepID=UPI002FE3F859